MTRELCARCRLPPRVCWCSGLPVPVSLRVPIVVVRHWREQLKSSNSVRAVTAAVAPCEVVDRGDPAGALDFVPRPGDVLVYPLEGVAAADPRDVKRLVVLDGTWKQARRALHHVPGLAGLPRLSVPPRDERLRRLRRPPNDEAMSTAEAIVGALRLVGEDAAAAQLDAVVALQFATIGRLRGWVG